jgi:hypothetical protein
MKRRRDIKRQQHLSQANRALISAVDLDEPQIKEPTPISVSEAVFDVAFNQEIDRVIASGQDPVEYAGDSLVKLVLRDETQPVIRPTARHMTAEEALVSALPPRPKRRTPPLRPPARPIPLALSEETTQEIVDAYASGVASVDEICATYSINPPRLYAAIRKAGVPLRGMPRRLPVVEKKEPQVMPTPPVSAPPVEVPPPKGVVSGLTEWTVTFRALCEIKVKVDASDFNDAAQRAERRHGGLLGLQAFPGHEGHVIHAEVVSVTRKLP